MAHHDPHMFTNVEKPIVKSYVKWGNANMYQYWPKLDEKNVWPTVFFEYLTFLEDKFR